MSSPKEHPADRVGNRYRLVEQLGVGGMSVVWRGYDEVLNRQVAVKVLAPRLASDAGFRHRIRMEAMAAARLIHPHITNVYDYGESTSPHGETVPYVVMELVDGESMSARVAREGALPWRDAVLACAEVAAALATAHARGVVHRDVTPGNVMLTSGGAKVVDFGISALAGENDLDEDGSLLGTPAYLAPERLDGGQVSPASDVYALGVVLYRVLTSLLPWQAGSTTELLQAHLYVEPAPLPPVDGLPPEVADLVGRCLRKQPADRPSSVEVARVLAAAVGVPAAIAVSPAPAGAASGVDPSAHTTILPWSPPPGGTATPGPSASGSAGAAAGSAGVAGSGGGADVGGVAGSGGGADVGGVAGSGGGADVGGVAGSGGGADVGGVAGSAGGSSVGRSSAGGTSPGGSAAGRSSVGAGRGGADPLGRHPGGSPNGRRRLRLFAAGAGVLAVAGMGWLLVLGRTGDDSITAAGSGPAGAAAAEACMVSYEVQREDQGTFDAALTVTNAARAPLPDWQLAFTFPGGQQARGMTGGSLVQSGPHVVVRPAPAKALQPGTSVRLTFVGAYQGGNPAPAAFTLGGASCRTQVSAKEAGGDPSQLRNAGAVPAPTGSPGPGTSGTSAGSGSTGAPGDPAAPDGGPAASPGAIPTRPGAGGNPQAPDPGPATGGPATPTTAPTATPGNGRGNGNQDDKKKDKGEKEDKDHRKGEDGEG